MTISTISKRRSNQIDKYDRILEAAFELFLEQGFDAVSVQEIADRADVAKGTFYLYFRDKEALRAAVITQKSNWIFQRALAALRQTDIHRFDDQIIFIIDYVIDVLAQNEDVLKLIAKDLSLGIFSQRIGELFTDDQVDILHVLTQAAEHSGVHLRNPKVLLFMIIELASSTCFSCILEAEPLELAVFKPYLFDAIRQLIHSNQLPPHPLSPRPMPPHF